MKNWLRSSSPGFWSSTDYSWSKFFPSRFPSSLFSSPSYPNSRNLYHLGVWPLSTGILSCCVLGDGWWLPVLSKNYGDSTFFLFSFSSKLVNATASCLRRVRLWEILACRGWSAVDSFFYVIVCKMYNLFIEGVVMMEHVMEMRAELEDRYFSFFQSGSDARDDWRWSLDLFWLFME